MKERQLGYCGLDCAVCPVFIAARNNDTPLKIKTAEEWSKLYAEYLGGNSLAVEAMNCSGCQSKKDTFIGCKNCLIRQCCREKGLTSCAFCAGCQTCEILNGFFTFDESHQQAKDNLYSLRGNGLIM